MMKLSNTLHQICAAAFAFCAVFLVPSQQAHATDHRVAMLIDDRFGAEIPEIQEDIIKAFPNAIRYEPGVTAHFLAIMTYDRVEEDYICTLRFVDAMGNDVFAEDGKEAKCARKARSFERSIRKSTNYVEQTNCWLCKTDNPVIEDELKRYFKVETPGRLAGYDLALLLARRDYEAALENLVDQKPFESDGRGAEWAYVPVAANSGERGNTLNQRLSQGRALGNFPEHVLNVAIVKGFNQQLIDKLYATYRDPSNDPERQTPLMEAVHFEDLDLASQLLQLGVSPNGTSGSESSPLAWATHRKHLEMVQLLLHAGASPGTAHRSFGVLPLDVALTEGSAEIARTLFRATNPAQAGEAYQAALLSTTIDQGQPKLLEAILREGISPDTITRLGMAPLHQAMLRRKENADRLASGTAEAGIPAWFETEARSLETPPKPQDLNSLVRRLGLIINVLLSAGANIETPDDNGRTSLQAALDSADWTMAEQLVFLGSNLEVANSKAQNPLSAAVEGNAESLARLLIYRGQDPNSVDTNGNPLLVQAISLKNEPMARLLLESGADVNGRTARGTPALNVAFFQEMGGLFQFMVENGADIGKKDAAGRTILHVAAENLHLPAVDILVKAKADVNAKDNMGLTPLHYVYPQTMQPMTANHFNTVIALISAGADREMADMAGMTAEARYNAVMSGATLPPRPSTVPGGTPAQPQAAPTQPVMAAPQQAPNTPSARPMTLTTTPRVTPAASGPTLGSSRTIMPEEDTSKMTPFQRQLYEARRKAIAAREAKRAQEQESQQQQQQNTAPAW